MVSYVFTGLAIANILVIVSVIVSAYMLPNTELKTFLHSSGGFFAALLICLTHGIVFIYFLGTGKSIKTACEEENVQGDFIRVTKRLKGRAFPFALTGSLAIIAAAAAGGAVSSGAASAVTHRSTVWFAFLWNLLCFIFEYRAICTNMHLLNRLGKALS